MKGSTKTGYRFSQLPLKNFRFFKNLAFFYFLSKTYLGIEMKKVFSWDFRGMEIRGMSTLLFLTEYCFITLRCSHMVRMSPSPSSEEEY